ncbi:mitochondrial ATPase [Aaosphaeria arxii CBS 175.79]|uniref:Mitochondrial ATPase n=1 Tax=Aaosphaeria arxii CBS 175.79 TaxID=1450172 RepID=A0A6A5XLQ2_9PLEO|nr:mitochondrial ATPase [Aaosphaeria arxii CBS 175.79]KAF2013836.1 mitochondrial ATPase [Aaosphaeria arxii CBS 175.79]
MPPNGTGLTITNPLVLYRSLIATNRITTDPNQHRLALHLQKLYENLIDYEPSVEYSQRLQQLGKAVAINQNGSSTSPVERTIGTRGIWTSLLEQKEKRDTLALTRVLTSHESAMNLNSPKGLMLHGEVGTGKSMLIDLFADCLPNRKKKRWHFNTFMLETFSRLETLRNSRNSSGQGTLLDEHSLLWLARDLIQTSPILFLDEFQLPDRAASKILSNLMTSFFQLGGVLIATSNRMPEELAKAAGMEFMRPVSRFSKLGWTLGFGKVVGRDDGPGQKGEFGQFLEVLRSRCEIWEMEGKQDYRRLSGAEDGIKIKSNRSGVTTSANSSSGVSRPGHDVVVDLADEMNDEPNTTLPKHYIITPAVTNHELQSTASYPEELDKVLHNEMSLVASQPIPWTPSNISVYGRKIPIPRQHDGFVHFSFNELCGATLGPADYITLASTYHTLILTDVPVMTFLLKNEARRLITLLDALYEARCRLLMTAAAGPDDIFFPEPVNTPGLTKKDGEEELTDDAVYPETYSEIHQDLTSPFRPNVSSYSPSLAADALEDDPPNRFRRVGSSFSDERMVSAEASKAPDFANIGGLTGEDELFAVKRARSRIWEMCSGRWWARDNEVLGSESEKGWWRPLPLASRHWERGLITEETVDSEVLRTFDNGGASDVRSQGVDASDPKEMFAHGASPFRTTSEQPPKIQSTHIWGTTKWGKRAGAWGKGVEGLEDRKKQKDEMKSVENSESGR